MRFYFWAQLMSFTCFPMVSSSSEDSPPADSGCLKMIKNYGCYCPSSKGRVVPEKCNHLFDEEIVNKTSGFSAPVDVTFPDVQEYLDPIEMDASRICIQQKYCEIKLKPLNPDWGIIDWCLADPGAQNHLQLLGPPHSPVCCDATDDKKYTMMCMRRDMNLQRFLPLPLLLSVYIKRLPRDAVRFRLSLVLFNRNASGSGIPSDFADKQNLADPAEVILLRVNDLVLDLSNVTKWEDL